MIPKSFRFNIKEVGSQVANFLFGWEFKQLFWHFYLLLLIHHDDLGSEFNDIRKF